MLLLNHIYDLILSELKKDGVILEDLLPNSVETRISADKIIELLERSYNLYYDDNQMNYGTLIRMV